MDVGPGDLVECVDTSAKRPSHTFAPALLVRGATYRVTECLVDPVTGNPVLRLAEFDHAALARVAALQGERHLGFAAYRFRKLPDIKEWLETSTDFEEPKRTPADAESVREAEGV